MGLISDQSRERSTTDDRIGGPVVDIIVMKESYGIANAPGVVAILGDCRPSDFLACIGRTACIRTPDGRSRLARIDGARDHGKTISFFFKGMDGEDIPIGSSVALEP